MTEKDDKKQINDLEQTKNAGDQEVKVAESQNKEQEEEKEGQIQEKAAQEEKQEVTEGTAVDEEDDGTVIYKKNIDSEDDEEEYAEDDITEDENIPTRASEEEFNWEKYENQEDVYSKEDQKQFAEMYDETLSTIGEKEIVEGTVVSISKREVVVNIGYKSEGVVTLNEFRYDPDLKVGDKVNVYIENKEDKNGQLVLSHKKARTMKAWDKINELNETGEIVKGHIKSRTKGGMIVDLFGIETFLPGSQIDVKPIRDYDAYVGKTMDFKVVKISHEFKNVVVSHKILIEAELEQQKKEIISKLEKGQVLEGTVKNITSYGVFMDLGGVDGLIHITDLSWGRINHPEEIVQLDQKLNVVVLDFDENKTRIALGLKQLTPHPWESLDPNLKVGDIVKTKVVVLADYGAFVEIKPGVEGLIHVSEMSWSQQLRSAQEYLQIGDEVEAKILTLDREERKMALSIKQLKPDPWDNIEEKYPVDSKHKAKVRNFTNFGIFVEIEEGIDGLIHISDLSWTKKINHPAEFTSIADDIEVVVLEINKENRRLRLGHKQLEENPWEVFEDIFTRGSVHEGVITEITDKGAKVGLPYGVEGFVSKKHLVKENGALAGNEEKLEFKVIDFNKDEKRIILSHSRVYQDDQKDKDQKTKKAEEENVKKTQQKLKKGIEKTTLGDLSDELANMKTEMAKDKKDDTPKKNAATAKKQEPEAEKADSNTKAQEKEGDEVNKEAPKDSNAKKETESVDKDKKDADKDKKSNDDASE
jgi:small subunit ribosomal protein S1